MLIKKCMLYFFSSFAADGDTSLMRVHYIIYPPLYWGNDGSVAGWGGVEGGKMRWVTIW